MNFISKFIRYSSQQQNNITNLNISEDTYVDATNKLLIPSNVFIDFKMHSINVIPNSSSDYAIFTINDANNIKIINANMIGDANNHLDTSGEFGFGIEISGCENITIDNCSFENFWGDGLIIGSTRNGLSPKVPKKITITNCYFNNNRRQGISILYGQVFINNCIIENTGGTPPGSAICIEPDWYNCIFTDVKINSVVSLNNKIGLNITIWGLTKEVSSEFNIYINDFSDYGSFIGAEILYIKNEQSISFNKGNITLNNISLYNNTRQGFNIKNWGEDYGFINCTNLIINNCNTSKTDLLFAINLIDNFSNILLENLYLDNPECENNFYINSKNITISNIINNISKNSGTIRADVINQLKLLNCNLKYETTTWPNPFTTNIIKNYKCYTDNFILPTDIDEYPQFIVYQNTNNCIIFNCSESIFPYDKGQKIKLNKIGTIAILERQNRQWTIQIYGFFELI